MRRNYDCLHGFLACRFTKIFIMNSFLQIKWRRYLHNSHRRDSHPTGNLKSCLSLDYMDYKSSIVDF